MMVKGSMALDGGQTMLSDQEFADSLLLITQRPPKCGDDLSKQRCGVCGTTNTPCWRKGPSGPKTLCNRCGVHWYQNKDRWDVIVEELKASRMDETVEQAAAPSRTVIKKKIDPQSAEAHPPVPDSQRCVKSNGRGWRCSQRKVSGYSYCAHHQRNWDGHEKQWRKAFPNLVYPRKSKKGGAAPKVAEGGVIRKRERKPKSSANRGGLALPEKKWTKGRNSDDSSEPDYVDSRFGKIRKGGGRSGGLVNEGSGFMMHLVLPSETEEHGLTRPSDEGYVSESDDSQLYHGTQLSEEPGESLESAKEVLSPNRPDLQPKQALSVLSDITALSPPFKSTQVDPPPENLRCVTKGGAGWRCPRPRQSGVRHCQYHTESLQSHRTGGSGEGVETGGDSPLSGMAILMRLQTKRKRSEDEGLAGTGLGLTWKTKMRRRPVSSRGGRLADVKQGSDMSQDSPRPKAEMDPPEMECGEEDDAAYLGVDELQRRLERSRGVLAAQQEKNVLANQELMRAKEGRLMAEKQVREWEMRQGGGEDMEAVDKLAKALQTERVNGSLLRPEALKLAEQYQHQAMLLSKQGAHLSQLRTSAEKLQSELAALSAEKKELEAELKRLHKANACNLCASGKLASTAFVPCGHLYCGACTSKLVPAIGAAFSGTTELRSLVKDDVIEHPPTLAGAVVVEEGCVGNPGKVIVGSRERTSRCPCCSLEVTGSLIVHKVDEEMDGAVSLLGLLASESSQ